MTFLLPGQLLCLVPDLGGVQEVWGDLDIAGCHLVNPLGDGDRGTGATAAAATDWRVAPGRAGGKLWGDGGRHPGCLAAVTHTNTGRCGQDSAGWLTDGHTLNRFWTVLTSPFQERALPGYYWASSGATINQREKSECSVTFRFFSLLETWWWSWCFTFRCSVRVLEYFSALSFLSLKSRR